MLGFDIGLSALRASQISSDVIGQNLTNASDPTYHRQVVEQSPSLAVPIGNVSLGTGVGVDGIDRLRDGLVETAIANNQSDLSSTQSQLDALNQLQAAFGTGAGSLGSDIDSFFNQLQQLAAQPQDTTLRGVVVSSAQTVTGDFHSLSNSFASLGADLSNQTTAAVQGINDTANKIAALNGQIAAASGSGVSPNDLLDQRDSLVGDLANQIDIRVVPGNAGQVTVIGGGVPLVAGSTSTPIALSTDADGNAVVSTSRSAPPLDVQGGTLGALLTLRNQTLPAYKSQLDSLAAQFSAQVDKIQTTGVGLSGPSTFLSSTRPVRSITAPLSKAGLALPATAGTLYVSVTNQATGNRTLTALSIDPTTESLQDVANAINSVPNLQAVTNAQTGSLQILSATGYSFDFTGQPPTTLSTAGITGTTVPTTGGSYTGSANGAYTFQVVGSGTVGVTPGLKLQVTGAGGGAVNTLDIGQGYSPGSSLTVGNGVTVSLASGTANAGDSFSLPTIAQPDTGGILAALGLGSFFQGSSAGDLQVNPALVSNPGLVAASSNGDAGDSTNLQRMIGLKDQSVFGNGTQTIDQFYTSIVGDVGTQVSDFQTLQTTQTALGQQLTNQQQAVSGVDTNQEMVNLLSSQQSFEAASKYISVVNDTLTALFSIF